MKYIKIDHSTKSDSTSTTRELDAKDVHCKQIGHAVVALMTMHNYDIINAVVASNNGKKVESSPFDIRALTEESVI